MRFLDCRPIYEYRVTSLSSSLPLDHAPGQSRWWDHNWTEEPYGALRLRAQHDRPHTVGKISPTGDCPCISFVLRPEGDDTPQTHARQKPMGLTQTVLRSSLLAPLLKLAVRVPQVSSPNVASPMRLLCGSAMAKGRPNKTPRFVGVSCHCCGSAHCRVPCM